MKNVLLLLLLIISISCSKQSKNVAIVQQLFDHFNEHQWEEMAALYIPQGEFKDPSLGLAVVTMTHEEIIEKYSTLQQIFPDIKDEIIAIYPSGKSHVIVEFISKGTALDGTKLELPICTVFTIKNGKISKDYTYYDEGT